MRNNIYAVTEIVGSSDVSIDDAITNAVKTAAKTLKHLEWFEVSQLRGHIEDGEVAHFQVGIKLGFRYEK